MAVIRSFVAVLIDSALRDKIGLAQSQLKKHSSTGVKWVAADHFHVTLKFLGNVQESDLPAIEAALRRAAASVEPFDVEMAGLGAFPNWRRPQVLWSGVREGAQPLACLAGAVEAESSKLGPAPEKGRFKAHVTIGRVKGVLPPEIGQAAQELGQLDFGTMRVLNIALMRSDLMRDGPVYTVLRTIDLGSHENE